MVEILIPISFFLAVFGILYVYFTTRNKERMAMIEKGADPALFASVKSRLGIKIGLLAMGAALGGLIGQLIHIYGGLQEEVAMISMIFFFGGIGLVAEHFLAKKESEKDV